MSRKQTKSQPALSPGRNMAMKVPPHSYDDTVQFYKEVLGLKALPDSDGQVGFEFSGMRLWIDKTPGLAQAELWLEVCCEDLTATAGHLDGAGIERCDEVEELPEGFQGFWVRNPAGVVHLVCSHDPLCA